MKKIALIPGTFDPVTVGHLELVRFASDIFDEVVVCICFNSEKTHLFAESERRNMLEKAVAPHPNVRVDVQHGMTADYAVSIGAEYIVRGIRNAKDSEYELKMADFNLNYRGIRTLFVPARADIAEVSSTAVREKLSKGEAVTDMVPIDI
jgi:pantetheine-phosphate adenylyltransferase